jgi:GT2 family glycosyltransferase
LIEAWQLQNMRQPIRDQDIPTTFSPDMAELLGRMDRAEHPDLYLWVESVGGHAPRNLAALRCAKACFMIDTHLHLAAHLEWARQFDFVFVAHLQHVDAFRREGLNAHWLPPACDPEVHARHPIPKTHEVAFVGSVAHHVRRGALLRKLGEQIPLHVERCFWDDMARVFSGSKIVFNSASRDDLNMRVFEALSTGSLLLTDLARASGQDVLFADGEDCAVYRHDDALVDAARFYLENDGLREQIAECGRRRAHAAHTYAHRVDDLLDVVSGKKSSTFSAQELREQSLSGERASEGAFARLGYPLSAESRSFVIPVLDYSPASPYNIKGLLDDLASISGDVIVVFNDATVAEQLRDHPRITRYCIMKSNVGVARAWNVGMHVAATPTVFIVNADVHLERSAVEALEHALWSLEGAACVGPQGSFFDFALCLDYCRIGMGGTSDPVAVDAVSGFLFAVKREHFARRQLQFEDAYTPCYFEEWDLGLQIKQAGLSSYVVPVGGYAHEESGSIRALPEIRFYGQRDGPAEILKRHRRVFLTKWREIAHRDRNPRLLVSGWREFGKRLGHGYLREGRLEEAEKVFHSLEKAFPDDPEVPAFQAALAALRKDRDATSALLQRATQIDPEFDVRAFASRLRELVP